MSVAVDILLAVTFFGIVFVHYRRGFMRSILMFARVLVSTVVTFLLGPYLSEWLASYQNASMKIPMYLISYAVLFAVSFVVMTILMWQAGKLVKLPVIKQCDKILGIVLGVITGLVAVSVMACILYFVLRLAGAPEVYEQSRVFKIWSALPNMQSLIDKLG
jgi:uncharacterized membrane protein required for colicin V production